MRTTSEFEFADDHGALLTHQFQGTTAMTAPGKAFLSLITSLDIFHSYGSHRIYHHPGCCGPSVRIQAINPRCSGMGRYQNESRRILLHIPQLYSQLPRTNLQTTHRHTRPDHVVVGSTTRASNEAGSLQIQDRSYPRLPFMENNRAIPA
jgi:hypothetical protein